MSAPPWEVRYGRKVAVTDIVIILASVFTAQFLRFGLTMQELHVPIVGQMNFAIRYSLVSLLLAISWFAILSIGGTRDPKVFGSGPTEYQRVVNTTFLTFGLFAIIAYSVRAEIGRGYLLIALPAGLSLLLITRWFWRKRLHRQRSKGRNTYRTLIVGERVKSAHVAREIAKSQYAGFQLLGAVTELGTQKELVPGLPVIASYDELLPVVDRLGVDALIMTSHDSIDPERIKRIGWDLEVRNIDLIVAIALTDIAGPRIHTRPVSNLPLIHVEHPKFTGRKQFAKRIFDLVFASFLLFALVPLFIVLALLVRLDSKGPAFFKQQRIGLDGRPFAMLKFRSMVIDAEDQLKGLLDQSDGNGMLFKIKQDPRITRVGAYLRKRSLDELPQLVNVLKGEMSLVGPRPPLPREVERYENWVHRRLLVKPGITGLWQVSGRSDLSWSESLRLDLYYVENWSMVGDLNILLRTVKTLIRPEGAY